MTEETISLGTRINTSLDTVDLAGLKELHLLLPIDSTLSTTAAYQLPYHLTLRPLSTLMPADLAMEAIQVKFTNTLMT